MIKPSMETPINAFEFCKIVDEVGLPAGVFNMVGGSGRKIGEALTTHPDVGLISMTGSVDVGKRIMEQAGSTLTRVNLAKPPPSCLPTPILTSPPLPSGTPG